MRRTLARHQAWLLLALLSLVSLAGAWAISLAVPLPARTDFNIVRWELRHLPGKWLYLTGELFRRGLSPQEQDDRLGRFLLLSAELSRLQRASSSDDPAQREAVERLRRERDALENDVEAIIEGRLTAVLEEAGLASSLPLLSGDRWVFPPVDFEFDQPPQVLSLSRRDRIELIDRRPLQPSLPSDEAVEIEADAEAAGDRSALVEAVTGAATYPSVVPPQSDYQRLVEHVAHEWVHHYLFFKPLGRRYFTSVELETLNETVANLAARDLAALLVERYPLPPEVTDRLTALSPPAPGIDVGAFLRQLRLEVDALLTEGRVAAAEALMEGRRQELAAQGIFYRRINQAFFASRSLYADTPASIDPLGRKLALLRGRAGSVGAFLRAAAGLTSGAELDRLLAERPQG